VFPQGEQDGRWYDDLFGLGWQLVTDDAEWKGLDPVLLTWLSGIGGTVIPLATSSTDLAAWFEMHDVRWALQRPEFYLFGTATDLDGAAALVAELRRQLQSPTPDG
jgi:hypothetical protein